ncbi:MULTISPECIES: MFS transporter [unclassified Streptomyces]|uniref:MFS transporter n=1 Tax=unclassified Streptomyces TaxID=2593676 RepID=UPI0007475043|nr:MULTISPECIES: MFS transporter [unclassified Streptomyces]KUL52927.1 MFS transporter [Streptomyces sp. NRRL S-1521]THC51866.1 MFS transporter [Streptomyces sp. A1499]
MPDLKEPGPTWVTRFKELPLALRVLFLAAFVNRAGMFVFPLLAVYLVRGKDLSTGEAGLLISVGSTGLLAGSLLSGPFCDLRGRRPALITALLLNAAGYLGLATLDGPPWTYAGLLFVALVGMGMFGPASNTLIADLAPPEQRPFAYTISYIGNNLGMGVGPLLGGLAAAYSYHVMFAGNILAGLLCAALIVLWVPRDSRRAARDADEPDPEGAETEGPAEREPGGRRGHHHVLLLVLASFFYVAPLIGLEYALPLAVTTVLDRSAGLVGVVYTINSVIVVGFGLLIEKRIQRYGAKALLVTAGALWAAGLAPLVFAFSLPMVLLSTVVWTLGEIIVSVVVPTYIAGHVHESRVGTFMALNGFVLGVARLIVPVGLGVIWQSHGHGPAFTVLFLTPVVGMAAFALLRVKSLIVAPDPRDQPSSSAPAEAPTGK